MDKDRQVQSFYRVAKKYPPDDDEYRSAQEKYGDPKPGSTLEVRICWHGLSAYGSEEAARWQQSFGHDHYTLFGDKDELKGYLTDFLVEV